MTALSNGKSKNKVKMSKADLTFTVVTYIICALIFIVIVYPLYFVVIASFSNPDAIQRGEMWFFPVEPSFSAYEEVFHRTEVWAGYRNTIIYTVGNTFFALLFTLPAAYVCGRKDFPLRTPLMIFFLIAMYFNGGLVPTYLQVMRLGLLDTIWALILPTSVSVYNLIIARTFFANTIPDELREAANLDGCSDFRFFATIVLPLSKAIIAVVGLYTAVAQWNSYMNALIYIQSDTLKPLQLVLRAILINNQKDAGGSMEVVRKAEMLKYALIVVSTVPIMCVYPFIQKYFAKGVMIGSVKG